MDNAPNYQVGCVIQKELYLNYICDILFYSPTNTINISLPSPAGTAAMRSSSKSKSIGNKKWEKYNKVKKAIKTHSDEEILQPPTKPRYKCWNSLYKYNLIHYITALFLQSAVATFPKKISFIILLLFLYLNNLKLWIKNLNPWRRVSEWYIKRKKFWIIFQFKKFEKSSSKTVKWCRISWKVII